MTPGNIIALVSTSVVIFAQIVCFIFFLAKIKIETESQHKRIEEILALLREFKKETTEANNEIKRQAKEDIQSIKVEQAREIDELRKDVNQLKSFLMQRA